MNIAVRTRGFSLTDAILEYVRVRMESSLARAQRQIARVEVRLRDINGDRGGEDKQCHVVVHLRNFRTVIVESVSRDLYAAIGDVAVRVREVISRRLHRKPDRRSLRTPPLG